MHCGQAPTDCHNLARSPSHKKFSVKATTKLLLLALACSQLVHADSIALKSEGSTYVVPALINGRITLNFTVDSGAADVSIPADVFSTLVRTGTVADSDLIDTQPYKLAVGSVQETQRFRIRQLKIGTIELEDVLASVAPAQGELLLGQSFLSRLNSWSIDNSRHVLLLNESPAAKSKAAEIQRRLTPRFHVGGEQRLEVIA